MFIRRWAVLAGALLLSTEARPSTEGPSTVLRAYGPGGPHHVLQECAELFERRHGVSVAVVKASPAELARKVPEDGDLYFGGAESMLEEFARGNPGVLDLSSVERLHPRRIGILVRKGNPLNIEGIACLERDDVDLMAVRLEDMAPFHAPGEGGPAPSRLVYRGQEGVEAWRSDPELDAWVTYKSWHVWLEDESEFLEIPCDHSLRYTLVALTRRTPHREAALDFVAFLKSPDARRIFVEHGWE